MGYSRISRICLSTLLLASCLIVSQTEETWEKEGRKYGRIVSTVTDPRVDEASGIAVSRRHPGVLYTHNDSGGRSVVYALEISTGLVLAVLNLTGHGVQNCDWEDIAVGPASKQSSTSYIYVGDIGGNAWDRCNTIYRVPEPEVLTGDTEVPIEDALKFTIDAANSETMMVDESGNLWLISKVLPFHRPRIFKIPSDAWSEPGAVDLGSGKEMPITFILQSPTGGDISVDGRSIVIKGYEKIIGYIREANRSIDEVLTSSKGVTLPYVIEMSGGEAVCWDLNAEGYYTLSEGRNSSIWYYNSTLRNYSSDLFNSGYTLNVNLQINFFCLLVSIILFNTIVVSSI